MNKITYIILLSFSLLLNSCQSQQSGQTTTKSDRIELFDQVWDTVNEQFYDQNFNGVDWGKKYSKYKPLIENCKNADTLFFLLNEMLFELNSSHCGVGLLSKLDNDVSPYLFKNGDIGLDIRIIKNQIIVTKVIQNSTSDNVQIQTGFLIEKIDGLSLENIEKKVKYKPPFNERNKTFHLTTEVLRRIYGQSETKVIIDFLDENNKSHQVILTRTKRQNGISLLEGLPTVYVKSESYFISKDIAYLTFNAFQPADLNHVLNNYEKVRKSKGLIIDFRGNDGGSIEAMKLFLGRFVSERKKYVTYINRNEENEDFIDPIGNKFKGEIVVLVDEMSISGAENSSLILQQLNIATIIGNQTPGQLLWGNLYQINDTISLVIPIYKLEYPNGYSPENNGITPDIEIELNRKDLLNGKDTQLERAIEYLTNE